MDLVSIARLVFGTPGSISAGIQSVFYDGAVAARSIFSIGQSVGAVLFDWIKPAGLVFRAAGVLARSMLSGFHSVFYVGSVAARRIFSILQSVSSAGFQWSWIKPAVLVGIVALGPAAAIGIPYLCIKGLGFRAAGVQAGSSAAGIQRTYYGGSVAAKSKFSTLQSVGAAGFAGKTVLLLGITGVIIALLIVLISAHVRNSIAA